MFWGCRGWCDEVEERRFVRESSSFRRARRPTEGLRSRRRVEELGVVVFGSRSCSGMTGLRIGVDSVEVCERDNGLERGGAER
jgi:hypothetical protein